MGNTETHHNVVPENKPIPELQQIIIEKNHGFYVWLYIALGFGGVVFIMIALGMFCNWCNKKEDDEELKNNRFLHKNANAERSNLSLFDGTSVTTSSVQPKSQSTFPDTTKYPPSYAPAKGMQFGSFNIQYPQQSSPNFEQQQDTFLKTLHDNKISNTSGGGRSSIGRADSVDAGSVHSILARKDSFLTTYESYNENEKTPLQLRVEEQNRQSSAYYDLSVISQEDLRRMDSIQLPDPEN